MTRLIDADALKKALTEIFDTVEVVTFDDIIENLDNAPTVEPKKGKWLKGDYYCETCNGFEDWGFFEVCSECGEENKIATNYCPHCGADMRGDEE